jgi:hypothetical protein
MERAAAELLDEPAVKGRLPRCSPDFVINIRSRSGERVQISATRFGKQFITGDGLKPARSISRGIEMLIRNLDLTTKQR